MPFSCFSLSFDLTVFQIPLCLLRILQPLISYRQLFYGLTSQGLLPIKCSMFVNLLLLSKFAPKQPKFLFRISTCLSLRLQGNLTICPLGVFQLPFKFISSSSCCVCVRIRYEQIHVSLRSLSLSPLSQRTSTL